jgi:hypothetical protein
MVGHDLLKTIAGLTVALLACIQIAALPSNAQELWQPFIHSAHAL